MRFHPYVWPFLLSVVAASVVITYAWQRRGVPASRSFMILTGLAGLWSLLAGLQVLAVGLELKYLLASLRYLAIATLPVAWLAFALVYTRRRAFLTPRRLAGLAAVPLVTLALVATNHLHGLMFALSWLETSGSVDGLVRVYGPWFWVHTAYSYGLIAAGSGLLLLHRFYGPRLYRQQARLMVAGALAPFLSNLLYLIAPSRFAHLDPTPCAFMLSAAFFAWGLYRFRLFDLTPVARAAVVESIAEAVVVFDDQQRVIDLNASAGALFGAPAPEAIGGSLETLTLGLDLRPNAPSIVERRVGGARRHLEWRVTALDDQRGRPSGMHVLTLRDVTDRHRAEAFEHAQRQILEKIAQGEPLEVVLEAVARFTESLSARSLRCLIALLDAPAGILRMAAAPSLPADVQDVLRITPLDADSCAFGTAATRRTTIVSADVATDPCWKPYAPYLLLHGLSACRAVPIFSSDDRVLGIFSLFYDHLRAPTAEDRRLVELATHLAGIAIERQRFVQDLIEAKEEAEEMARLKSAFLANMSHEIRTPLTSIIGFSEILAGELEAEYQDLAARIGQGGKRLLATLNSVLDYARLEAGRVDVRWEVLDLLDVAEETVTVFRAQAEAKGIALVLEAPPEGHALARLDRGLLVRVLNNLVGNAVKFTERGQVALRLGSGPEHVQIDVIDTGQGISEAFLPQIFDEFRQESSGLARSHEGSGLGLRITKQLVERMEGTIDVESRQGVGSTFTVTFPRYRPVPSTDDRPPLATAPPLHRRRFRETG